MRPLLATIAALAALAALVVPPPSGAGAPLWVEIAKLHGSDTDARDQFGSAIAIDGATLVVGAFGKDGEDGAAYVFERLPEAPARWQETKKLTPAVAGDEFFGKGLAISGDTIAIHASTESGSATNMYERGAGGAGQWGLVARFTVAEGGLRALDGDTLVHGDSDADVDGELDAGAVYIFEQGPGGADDWRYVTTLTASDANAQDHFGQTVAVSGDRLLIGAPQVRDQGIDAGAAYIFERDATGTWTEVAKLLASDGDDFYNFGANVDLDAETAIVGANAGGTDEGAYIFERTPEGEWLEILKLQPPDGQLPASFGDAVAIAGDVGAVTAWSHDPPGLGPAGAAYVFERDQGGPDAWGGVAKVVASDADGQHSFGREASMDGNTLVVGDPSHDALGFSAGAVYLFSRTAPLLAVTGSCPGELEVTVIGTTPAGQVAILGAESEGITPIPSGPCEGTELGLDGPGLLFAGTATSGGDLALVPTVGEGTCGRYLQAVDLGTCATSNVSQVP